MSQSDVTPFMMSAAEKYGLVGLWRWWTLGDLNPRPSGCKPDDLPADLSALILPESPLLLQFDGASPN